MTMPKPLDEHELDLEALGKRVRDGLSKRHQLKPQHRQAVLQAIAVQKKQGSPSETPLEAERQSLKEEEAKRQRQHRRHQ